MKTNGPIEIEIDTPQNNAWFFPPIGVVRGRFDTARIKSAGAVGDRWPDAIPSQRVGLDLANGLGYLCEPLHDPEHAATRERISRGGRKLDPARQEFVCTDVDVQATWLHWIKRALQSGIARLVRGVLPDELPGTPQRHYITRPPVSDTARLAAAIEKQNELLAQSLARR